jgi:NADH-quinone oxidoreductase subunit L
VFLVFFGEPRFEQHAEGEEHAEGAVHPHESPWTMTLPLVLLAGLAIAGGALNLPFTDDVKFMEHWLHPVLEFVTPDGGHVSTEAHIDVATATIWVLALLATLAAIVGIAYAAQVFLRRKATPIEPEILARGWYYDESIAAFMGGPGRAGFEAVTAFDEKVVDGAVNGVGAGARTIGGRLRVTQTGFVRNYALVVAFGAVLLMALLLARGI